MTEATLRDLAKSAGWVPLVNLCGRQGAEESWDGCLASERGTRDRAAVQQAGGGIPDGRAETSLYLLSGIGKPLSFSGSLFSSSVEWTSQHASFLGLWRRLQDAG